MVTDLKGIHKDLADLIPGRLVPLQFLILFSCLSSKHDINKFAYCFALVRIGTQIDGVIEQLEENIQN
jgi:hypothetical protein